MEITVKSKIRQVMNIPSLKPFGKYFMFTHLFWMKTLKYSTLEQIQNAKASAFNAESMAYGLRALKKAAETNPNFFSQVYSQEEICREPEKADVAVMHFLAEGKAPYIVICPGGGYQLVSSMAEGYPVAARFNEAGYHVFVLNYRVGNRGVVMPEPIDDLAAAVRYIQDNADRFRVEKDKYAVCGFSAGGNLVGQYCGSANGYAAYGLPKPLAVFPVYPEVTGTRPDGSEDTHFFETILGKKPALEEKEKYRVINHVDAFPPAFIVACKDDKLVDISNSHRLAQELDKLGIPNELFIGETGGHGFGEGRDTGAEGWIPKAAEFLDRYVERK